MVSTASAAAILSTILIGALASWPARATALGYGGRLVDAAGMPLAGPVDMTVRFFGSEAGGEQLGTSLSYTGVTLANGVFQLSLSLSDADQGAIFGDGSQAVFVEIEVAGTVYPRQSLAAVPLALRVPVDNASLVYGVDAKLAVGQVSMSQVAGLESALAAKSDATQASGASAGYLSATDWTRFDAKQPAITAATSVDAGSLTTAQQSGLLIKPYGVGANETGELRFAERSGPHFVGFKAPDAVTADQVWTLPAADGASGDLLATDGAGGLSWVSIDGADILSGTIGGSAAFAGSGGVQTSGAITGTGNFNVNGTGAATTELRFGDNDNSNYVGLKAPGTVAANTVWTLPAADGSAGQFLTTNGAGVLTWGSPAGSGDLMASANLSDLSNVATARGNLGLGTLATANAVTSTQITDDTITNADISGTAAIATSKLSGAVISISGHGLGGLATLSAVGSSEITDGSIADADIAGSAAIATSKLSGPLTAVSGHGLGALATVSAVGSTEITDGAVASSDIADDTIANADVSPTAAIATSKLSGALTSISGHGLGTLAALSAVTTSEIADGTVADADISATAAIATSKLSGALTAVSGHGLGALASLSAIGTNEITDGAINDADVSTTAAIDASKIANGTVSSTEFQYLDGLTSGIQAQLDAKASAASPTFTGVISMDLGSAAAPSYGFTGDSNTGVWSSGADTVNISTGGSERLRVTSTGNTGIGTTAPAGLLDVNGKLTVLSSGNVGIGTTAPAGKFHVAVSSNQSIYGSVVPGLVFQNTDSGTSSINSIAFSNAATAYSGGYYGALVSYIPTGGATTNVGGALTFATKSTTGVTWLEAMRLVDGNVGIGTTAPATQLHVYNTGTAGTERSLLTLATADSTSGTSANLDFAQVTTTVGRIRSVYEAGANLGMSFHTYSSSMGERMRISAGGNVGIGTVSPSSYAHGGTGRVLEVSNNLTATNSQAHLLLSTGTTNASSSVGTVSWALPNASAANKGVAYISASSGSSSTSANPTSVMDFATRNTGDSSWVSRMRISEAGNVGVGTSSPGAKLKVEGGQIAGTYLSSSNTTIDWNAGNIQSTSAAAGTITFTAGSMVDGGSYTLALNNATGGNYTFASTGLTFKCNPACPVTVTAGKDTVATFIKAGSTVYVSWVKDFQ